MGTRPRPRALRVLLATLLLATLPVLPGVAPPAGADVPGGVLVSDDPAPGTPHVLDGRVYSVVRVGDTMVLGGTFTRARNDGESSHYRRDGLLAFDATTGRILPDFAPSVPGDVWVVRPAGDGATVYVGGQFTRVDGRSRPRLARVRLSDGSLVESFDPVAINGAVRDLRLAGGRLWVAGTFSRVDGTLQRGLTTLDPATGRRLPYLRLGIGGVQNGGRTGVHKIDVTPDGSRLVAVGNFRFVGGAERRNLVQLDLTGSRARLSTMVTRFYADACMPRIFDTHLRDVDYSPDGSFMVVSTTGGHGGAGRSCDSSARFETRAVGRAVAPSWVDHTGGDTTYAVEITDGAVYVGGHFRWQNNSFAQDRAGQGAVARPGIAALDPVNGLPLDWNPTRARGVGVFDLLATGQGLWVVSDTVRIGADELHGRVALLPTAGGAEYDAQRTPRLPGTVYVARDRLVARDLGAGRPRPGSAPQGPVGWRGISGAFMDGDHVYLAGENGGFVRRRFDGSSWGRVERLDTHHRLTVLKGWVRDLRAMSGMFADGGRIYFTRPGSNRLYYRYFTPSSGVVGVRRIVASRGVRGVALARARGLFLAGGRMYWATPSGDLRSVAWHRGRRSGRPVAGTVRLESGPRRDGVGWASPGDMFVAEEREPVSPAAELVGSDGSNQNERTHEVTVPADVEPGDLLLLRAVANTTSVEVGGPGGWTTRSSPTGRHAQGRLWSRTAQAGDAGRTLTVTTSDYAQVDVALTAYRGLSAPLAVLDHAARADNRAATRRVSPRVDNPAAGSVLVTSWAGKNSADTRWTVPGDQTRRLTGTGAGGGRINAVVTESDPLRAGRVGGLAATTDVTTYAAIVFSTVIGPA